MSTAAAPHIHRCDDGRGARDVFLNGELITYVVFADTEQGIVEVYEMPARVEGTRLATRTLHGTVTVDQK